MNIIKETAREINEMNEMNEMIEALEFIEVFGCFIHPEVLRKFAFENQYFFLQRNFQDSCILWNGKGLDPRKRH